MDGSRPDRQRAREDLRRLVRLRSMPSGVSRARPDLAKSEKKGEGSDLVRAYLLIDAALA